MPAQTIHGAESVIYAFIIIVIIIIIIIDKALQPIENLDLTTD